MTTRPGILTVSLLLLLLSLQHHQQGLHAVEGFALDNERKAASAKTATTIPRPKSNYYSYKTFKKLGLPALAYSAVSKVTFWMLGLKPTKLLPTSTATNTATNYVGMSAVHRRRVAIVTGSNTGVGYETVKSLVQEHGMEVIVACRSTEKGVQACQQINNKNQGKGTRPTGMAVFVQQVDLSDLDSVRRFGKAVQEQYETIDVLVNNAGRNSAGASDTSTMQPVAGSGALDVVFTTNFLGHFLLTNILLEKCQRIVNLASVMHHFPKYAKGDDDNINDEAYWSSVAVEPDTPVENVGGPVRKTYGPSKLASLLFSVELNRRYRESLGIRSIAVNPGAVNSDIWRAYPSYMRKLYGVLYLTSKQGSSTSVAASVSEDLDHSTIYLQPYRLPFQNKKKALPPFPMFEMLGPYAGYVEATPRLPDDDGEKACRSLFAVCEELTGCKFAESMDAPSTIQEH